MGDDFLAIGAGELDANEGVRKGDEIKCRHCGGRHKIEHGTDTKTGAESDKLGFYKCGEHAYLASVDGKLLNGERRARRK